MTRKNNKKRKHALFHAAMKQHQQHEEHRSEDEDDSSNQDTVSPADLATTLRTLQTLVANSTLFQSPPYKQLRRTLHPLVLQQMQSYQATDYRQTVTTALRQQHWEPALTALKACRDFQQVPKLGTVQRWVRDCDAAPSTCHYRLLRAILECNDPHDGNLSQSSGASDTIDSNNSDQELAVLEPWLIPQSTTNLQAKKDEESKDGSTTHPGTRADVSSATAGELQWRVIYREEAAQRKPPNHYDLLLHTTAPDWMQWNSSSINVVKHPVPFVPGAFVLDGVLQPHECYQLRYAASQLGFSPDHPVIKPQPTGIDSCEWLVDASILGVLNQRIQNHVPNMDGKQWYSINPRFRFFRYGAQCVYRPHLDGSWPACRLTEQGTYECDDESGVKSYWTFLVYLNDDFVGGETRFYYLDNGSLTAQGVQPKMGSVLVFPQGNTASLIHEGSAVTKGTKYVIRTDILYQSLQD